MAASVEDNNAQRDHSEEARDKKRQLCFEITKAAYDFTITDIDGLDTKAGNLITFIGVILGIYSGFGLSILNSIDKKTILYECVTYYNLSLYILIGALILLLISICCALAAYKLYNITIVPYPPYFYEHYVINESCTNDDILNNLTLAFVSAFQLNNDKRGDKSYFISWSFLLLLLGSAAGVIFMGITLIAPKV